MRPAFYDSESYRTKQSDITRRNHRKGIYVINMRTVVRSCAREGCKSAFATKPANGKRYCGSSCAASVRNSNRRLSIETRNKISEKLKGTKSPFKGRILVPRVSAVCSDPACKKAFTFERYRSRKYCSRACAFRVVSSQPTSARASRGKSGVRQDIHPTHSFHSRWEANIARLYRYLGIEWMYEPKTFNIGSQTYTPDFYLPSDNTYVEIKNFWSSYSEMRDSRFRKAYPQLSLKVILKVEYLELEQKYAKHIPGWEYRNSPVPKQ